MDNNKLYDTGLALDEEISCAVCGEPLKLCPVTFSYMDHSFPVELPACEKCTMVYVPEELARGKILHVERSLEDK